MKNLLLTLFLLCSIQSAFATHIIGGSISYEYLGNDQYNIKLEVLRDCYNGNPSAFFDDPAKIGIFDSNNTLLDSLYIPFDPLSNDTISILAPNNICVFPPNICVHKTTYQATLTLPYIPGGYTLAYQRCCRSQVISNIVDPLDTGMTFHTFIDPALVNSSPQFNSDFPFAVFSGTPFIYNAAAFDPDGDSLVYELTTPFTGADPATPEPTTPSPPPYDPVTFIPTIYSVSNMLGGNYPLTLNPESGEMSAIPSTLGVFQIAYAVKEYRNNELVSTTYREFAFVVIAPATNQSYDISGQVFVDGDVLLDLGRVQILERDISTDSLSVFAEQSINGQGEYSFNDIPPGVFYTKAVIDSASMYFDDYLPTYYNSAAFWYDANPLNQCDTTQINRDIHMIHIDSLTGMLMLSGFVTLPDGGNDPVEDLDLFIVTENGLPIQTRRTNSAGYFQFENLSPGNYFLYTDLINSSIDNTNPPLIVLDENKTVNVYLYEDYLSLETTTGLGEQMGHQNYEAKVYPNPTDENILLQMNVAIPDQFSIDLYNIHGQLLRSIFDHKNLLEGSHSKAISLKRFPVGTYYLRIQNTNGIAIKKIVKQ